MFLEDFLKQNGYHDVADAITDSVAAATTPGLTARVEGAAELPVASELGELAPRSSF